MIIEASIKCRVFVLWTGWFEFVRKFFVIAFGAGLKRKILISAFLNKILEKIFCVFLDF